MITYISHGNIFDANTEALVNPVNCVGVMGAGLAKEFKIRFPENYQQYRWDCGKELVKVGKMHVFNSPSGFNGRHRYIINFPTKRIPQERSCIRYISDGLNNLIDVILEYQIKSIAIPKLGCGLGGLEWKVVKCVMDSMLHDETVKDVNILIYQ